MSWLYFPFLMDDMEPLPSAGTSIDLPSVFPSISFLALFFSTTFMLTQNLRKIEEYPYPIPSTPPLSSKIISASRRSFPLYWFFFLDARHELQTQFRPVHGFCPAYCLRLLLRPGISQTNRNGSQLPLSRAQLARLLGSRLWKTSARRTG